MSSSDALLRENKLLGKLYDAEALMSVDASVANGFVVLLTSPGQNTATGTSDQPRDVSLAFMALVQGNVLEACFGVLHPSRREDTPASRSSREGKELLEECDSTDTFRQCAVDAYRTAFLAVVNYRTKYDRLNCLTRCFRAKKLQRQCETELHEAFLNLAKAIAEHR
eukprot:Nitzschia sp. Nitz4//scaffold182_size44100//34188//34688//NITZ4_007259-RA/size44100-processed-gene-0.44-mRNA-1//1//CDS//3329539580//3966//frame0